MFNTETLKEYYKRSYFAVDGLWFMKTEERYGFEDTLKIDADVWEVLAKIQARKAKELLKIKGNKIKDLIKALELKWAAEGYEYKVSKASKDQAEVLLLDCPWLSIMKKAKRDHLTPRIGECVCTREYGAWAKEFNPQINVTLEDMLCRDKKPCRPKFNISSR